MFYIKKERGNSISVITDLKEHNFFILCYYLDQLI